MIYDKPLAIFYLPAVCHYRSFIPLRSIGSIGIKKQPQSNSLCGCGLRALMVVERFALCVLCDALSTLLDCNINGVYRTVDLAKITCHAISTIADNSFMCFFTYTDHVHRADGFAVAASNAACLIYCINWHCTAPLRERSWDTFRHMVCSDRVSILPVWVAFVWTCRRRPFSELSTPANFRHP